MSVTDTADEHERRLCALLDRIRSDDMGSFDEALATLAPEPIGGGAP